MPWAPLDPGNRAEVLGSTGLLARLRLEFRQKTAVYCINLRRSCGRRDHMHRQFARAGWRATVVPAIDGSAGLDVDRLVRDGWLSPDHESLFGPMSATEIGCFLSHEKAWRLIREKQHPHALICEDDIAFRSPVPPLEELVRVLPEDCDILYLYYINSEPDQLTAPAFDPELDRPVAGLDGYEIFSAWSCGGTQCYLVTAQGLAKMLSESRPIRYPVDGYLGRLSFAGRLKVYATHPMVVRSGAFASTIS